MVGEDIEFLRDFARTYNLKLSITIFPFMGIWNLPALDIVDVVASGISLTPDRMTTDSFWTQPYTRVRRSALVRAEDFHDGYGEFKRFTVVPDSVAHSHALRHLPSDSRLQFTQGIELGVESLLRGETDAVGTGSVSARHQAGSDSRLKALDLHTEEDAPELISFFTRRESSLLNALNNFINSRNPQNYN